MNKKEQIEKLIGLDKYSFEEICELSGSQDRYVKGVYSKLKLNWKDFTDEQNIKRDSVTAKDTSNDIEVVEEADTEAEQGGVSGTEGTTDSKGTEGTETDKPKVATKKVQKREISEKARSLIELCLVMLDVANNKKLNRNLKLKSEFYREKVASVIAEEDFSLKNKAALNSRYAQVRPRPANNCHREIRAIHKYIHQIFTEIYKK